MANNNRNNRNRRNRCDGWCLPTSLYFVLGMVGILLNALRGQYVNGMNVLLLQIGYVLVWTYIFYWLCSNCYNGWAWFLLLFPVIMFFVIFVVYEAAVLGMVAGRAVEIGAKKVGEKVDVVRRYQIYY